MIRLRKIPKYADAHIYVAIEANNNFITAKAIADNIRVFSANFTSGTVEIIKFDPHKYNRDGVWITNVVKNAYVILLQELVSSASLRIAKQRCSENLEGDVDILKKQMRGFKLEIEEPKNPSFQKPKHAYSGKAVGNKDDLVCALGIAIQNIHRLRHDYMHRQLCQNQGWRN